MKVIGGKHYVEGGPKCNGGGCVFDNCEGTGIFKIYPGAPLDDTPDQSGIEKPCSACHGTGVQAVEDWSENELYDYAKRAGAMEIRLVPPAKFVSPEGKKMAERKTWWCEFLYNDERMLDDHSGEGATGRNALIAAVIAVAEEAE